MPLSFSIDRWLRLPSRIALLLGLGALSAAGANSSAAQAHTGKEADSVPQKSAEEIGDLRIWTEGGRIYLAEPGKPGEDLSLGDTLEAQQLRQLLEQHGATAASRHVPFGRMLLVGGGGCGFNWPAPENRRPASTSTSSGLAGFGPAKAVNPHQPGPAEKPAPRRNPGTGQASARG